MDGPGETVEATPVPLAYAGEREAEFYRRRYRRALTAAIALGLVVLVIGGLLAADAVRDHLSRRATVKPMRPGFVVRLPSRIQIVQRLPTDRPATPPRTWPELAAAGRFPAGRVAYEEDLVAAAKLTALPEYTPVRMHHGKPREAPTPAAFAPPAVLLWPEASAAPYGSHSGLLFAGLRQAQGGPRRFVYVFVDANLDLAVRSHWDEAGIPLGSADPRDVLHPFVLLKALAAEPPGEWRNPAMPEVDGSRIVSVRRPAADGIYRLDHAAAGPAAVRPPEAALRFFTGRADPDDPSRFTIAFEIGPPGAASRRGEIRGRLLRDDTLELIPTAGRIDDRGLVDPWFLPPSQPAAGDADG